MSRRSRHRGPAPRPAAPRAPRLGPGRDDGERRGHEGEGGRGFREAPLIRSFPRKREPSCRGGGKLLWVPAFAGTSGVIIPRQRPGGGGGAGQASLAVKPRRRNLAAMSANSAASPPNRWAMPVTSSMRPSGGSGAMNGLQRSDQRESFSSTAASFSGSCSRDTRWGTRARASARRSPGLSPRDRAAVLQAASRKPCAPACTSTSG
jgi:hypothetical protein